MSSNKIEALFRGLGQGASLGLNDDLSPAIAGKLTDWFGPEDPEGIPREYAAGSAYDDMRNNERRENADAEAKYPTNYRVGQIAGGMPSSIAMSGIGAGAPNALARIASAGLGAGVRGGVEGAGLAEDGNRLNAAARAAAPSAALGMAGAAAPTAVKAVKDLFKGGPPGPLAPAMATVGSGAQPSAREVARGAQAARSAGTAAGPVINRALGGSGPPSPPPRPPPARTVPPPRRGKTSMVDEEAAGGRKVGPEEHTTHRNAIPPPESEAALDASMISGTPKNPEPIEFMRKYKVDFGPKHGEKIGAPEHGPEYRGEPAETKNQFNARFRYDQDPLHWQARGGAPARTDSGMPRNISFDERSAQRGPSMHAALLEENSPDQLARLPKMDTEYAQAAEDAPIIRAMQRAALKREEAAAANNAALKQQAEANAGKNVREFDLDAKAPTAEYKLDSKAATNLDRGGKTTDVKKLMKRHPDDSDD